MVRCNKCGGQTCEGMVHHCSTVVMAMPEPMTRGQIEQDKLKTLRARIAELEAERDKYKLALEEIIKWADHYKSGDCFNEIDDIEAIARTALKGEE